MLHLLIALFITQSPVGSVTVPADDCFDAVWVPPGTVGAVVAGPWEGAVFEVVDGD